MTNIEQENKRFLDVVNENDQIIGSESRIQIHKLGLLHREIHVWMFDENKNVFFQKRGLHRPSAGLLDATVGGHVNKGESYLEAAIREINEETGISATPADLIIMKKFKRSPNQPENSMGSTVNNFIRTVYIYKHPISESLLKKEEGIPMGGFQKMSYDFLMHLNKADGKEIEIFDKSILAEELTDVLEHIQK